MPEEKLHNLQPYESRDGAWGLVNKVTGVSVEENECYLKSEVDALIKKNHDDMRLNFDSFYDEWKEKLYLRRSLWISRKERAKSEKCYWMHIHQKHGSPAGIYYRINHRESSKDGTMRLTPREWYRKWMRVEALCERAKKDIEKKILKRFADDFFAFQRELDPDDAQLLNDHLFELT